MASLQILEVTSPQQLEQVKILFQAYQSFLGVPLDFQQFDEELKSLPGKYVPPYGNLYLALHQHQPVGCAAFYKMDTDHTCEIKRVYVAPQAQGLGLGRALMQRVLIDAKAAGYRYARLDSLKRLERAAALYQKLGFYFIEPYNHNPNNDVYYMELDLSNTALVPERSKTV